MYLNLLGTAVVQAEATSLQSLRSNGTRLGVMLAFGQQGNFVWNLQNI